MSIFSSAAELAAQFSDENPPPAFLAEIEPVRVVAEQAVTRWRVVPS